MQCYYDSLNGCVKKDFETGTDVMYTYDGWQCIEERDWDSADGAWEPRRQYVYGSQYIDEVVLFDRAAPHGIVTPANIWLPGSDCA